MSAQDVTSLEQRAELRRRINGLVELLGIDELAVLELVAHGLARGRDVYGELVVATDKRDFVGEAREEIRDSLIYFAAALVRMNRGGR